MQANEAAWYDEFYQKEQAGWAPWYRFTLSPLKELLTPQTRLVELGCGQGLLLRHLARERLLPEEQIYGIDQSRTAVEFVKDRLPEAKIQTGDIYHLPYPKNFFDICLLMETIEHFEDPRPALAEVNSVLAPGGSLFVSFPNYLSLPWLLFRWFVQLIGRPELLVLQPIDKIYTVFQVIEIVKRAGFSFERCVGSNYGPPYFYRLERDWMTRTLNSLGMWCFSFHPILIFSKPKCASNASFG